MTLTEFHDIEQVYGIRGREGQLIQAPGAPGPSLSTIPGLMQAVSDLSDAELTVLRGILPDLTELHRASRELRTMAEADRQHFLSQRAARPQLSGPGTAQGTDGSFSTVSYGCRGGRPSYGGTVAALAVVQIARGVNQFAGRGCDQTAFGFNVALICIISDGVLIVAESIWIGFELCTDDADSAEILANYQRNEYISGQSNTILAGVGSIQSSMGGVVGAVSTLTNTVIGSFAGLNGALSSQFANLTSAMNASDAALTNTVQGGVTTTTSRIADAESNIIKVVQSQGAMNVGARLNAIETLIEERVEAKRIHLETLTVSGDVKFLVVATQAGVGNVDVLVHGAGCVGFQGFGFSGTDDEHVVIVNGDTAPLDLTIEVFVNSITATDCNRYDLLLATQTDPCAAMLDDGLENNDDCGSSLALLAGTYMGLAVFQTDLDYYRITVAPGEEVQVECARMHDAGDVNLFLYDPLAGCGGGFAGGPVAYAISATDGESLRWPNLGPVPVEVILEVGLSPIVASGCNQYDLDVALVSDPCAAMFDDAFEDNDDCGSAVALGPGLYNGLFVGDTDPDYFSVTVQPGEVLGVDCKYTWLDGALVLLLWDPTVGCGTGPFTQELAAGFTPVDNERLFWLNGTGTAATILIEVAIASAPLGRCNTYDLEIDMFPDPCPGGLGGVFCRGISNSTGIGSSLCASGSDAVDDNDVLLTVTDLPSNTVGYIVVSQNPTVTLINPAGSVGQLCVASPSISRQAPILSSGSNGTMQLQIDLLTTPQPTTPAAIQAGETWCWQLWHPDQDSSGAATSNFSSACSVTFR